MLVLGMGGGREAIALAKMGYDVTGVDFVPEMVRKARENAVKLGVTISVLVQDLSQLSMAPLSYDVVWLSAGMYSSIPTRDRRVATLRKIRDCLAPGGHFLCQFLFYPGAFSTSRLDRLARIFAYLTLGNLSYETGDTLLGNAQFMHYFSSDSDLESEFEEAGFEILRIIGDTDESMRGAVLRRPNGPRRSQ
jgi:SAM-dependent methyltransferase